MSRILTNKKRFERGAEDRMSNPIASLIIPIRKHISYNEGNNIFSVDGIIILIEQTKIYIRRGGKDVSYGGKRTIVGNLIKLDNYIVKENESVIVSYFCKVDYQQQGDRYCFNCHKWSHTHQSIHIGGFWGCPICKKKGELE